MWTIETTDNFDAWLSEQRDGHQRFYSVTIPVADREFTRHLNTLINKE